MQIIADLHTHTLSATHAFNTLDEMAAKAALGYAALAITDHGPAMPDAPHMWHFANQTALPLVLHGVAMMYGAEANVMDTNGGLDFAQSRLRALDWVVASIHSPCIPGLLTEKEATRLWLALAPVCARKKSPPACGWLWPKTLMWIASAIPSSRITAMTMTL